MGRKAYNRITEIKLARTQLKKLETINNKLILLSEEMQEVDNYFSSQYETIAAQVRSITEELHQSINLWIKE